MVLLFTVCDFIFRSSIFHGQCFHFVYDLFIGSKYPQEQAKEKSKEYNERDYRPDRDVLYTLKDVFIHGFTVLG
jgi:hypothetical protein